MGILFFFFFGTSAKESGTKRKFRTHGKIAHLSENVAHTQEKKAHTGGNERVAHAEREGLTQSLNPLYLLSKEPFST